MSAYLGDEWGGGEKPLSQMSMDMMQQSIRAQSMVGSAQAGGFDQTRVRFIGFSDRPPRMVACRVPVFRVKAGSRRWP